MRRGTQQTLLPVEPESAVALEVTPAPVNTEAIELMAALGRPADRYTVEPTRTTQPPQLDGVIDEAEWQNAAMLVDFIQQEPSEGAPATERTVVRLMYDAEMLYVGVEAYDSEPTGIIATEMRRDSRRLLDEDNFQIILQSCSNGFLLVWSVSFFFMQRPSMR